MPSPLAEALAERLLDRLPPDRAYDRAALEDAALPRTVRRFLERMMTRRVEIERERLRVLRQPWLDHAHEEVRRAEGALLAAVRRHVQIPAAAWERVLRHASERVAAYLVRPVPALEDFVFGTGAPDALPEGAETSEKQDALPADVVLRRLSYFAAYPYLHKATSAYIEQRDVPAFERQRLVALLRRVDEKMCADHDTAGWLRLLQPLFALAETAYPNHDGLPVAVLEAFFDEKKADLPLQRLRTAHREHGFTALSPAALGEVIAPAPGTERTAEQADEPASEEPSDEKRPEAAPASPVPPEEEPRPRKEPAPQASARPSSPRNVQAPPAAEEKPDAPPPSSGGGGEPDVNEPAETGDSPVPLWKRYRGTADEGAAEKSEPHSADAPASPGESGADPRPRWQQFSVVSADEEVRSQVPSSPPSEANTSASSQPASSQSASPAEPAASPESLPESSASSSRNDRSLRALEEDVLGHAAENRALFVRSLFGGSEAEYARVLRRLHGTEDWRTATQIIARDVFRAHKVNIYSDPARSFTNAVEGRFR